MRAFISRHSAWIFLTILILASIAYVVVIPLSNSDIQDFLLPWHEYIVKHGRIASIGQEFANYTPPYLYIFSAITILDGFTPVQQIKFVSWIGNGFLCVSCYYVFLNFYNKSISAVSSVCIAVTPTVFLNGPVWGQCDAYYTSALVLALGFALREKWAWAVAAFGLAFSLKLQAVFLAPAFAVFFFRRKIKVWMLPIPVLTYYLMMLPAIIAGRSVKSVSLVYFQQFETFAWLAPGAPNFWTLIQNVLRKLSLPEVPYESGVVAGISLAVIAFLLIVIINRRAFLKSHQIMLVFMTSAITVPFFLPKMHDRYFFAADVLSVVCAICSRSKYFVVIAICVQFGSFMACLGTPFGYYIGSAYGSVLMSLAVFLIWLPHIFQRPSDLENQTLPCVSNV